MDAVRRSFLIALIAGEWAEKPMAARAAKACGRLPRFVRPFARRLLAAFPTRPQLDDLLAFAAKDLAFRRQKVAVVFHFPPPPPDMDPVPAAVGWGVPPIRTAGELADHLGLEPGFAH